MTSSQTNPPDNLQDKLAWCEYGEIKENEFVSSISIDGVDVIKNPDKSRNKLSHDLLAQFPSDLKTVRTIFRTADRYGLDPDYTIGLNRKDVEHYSRKYPNIIILFDIEFDKFKGIKMASLDRILRLIHFGAPEHFYLGRKDDSDGNAKSSFLFDLRLFDTLIVRAE
jgi:hypothetical protein